MSDLGDTPSRLVAAAERLFAEGGEEATSLRAVTREAISNAAAVHYHFGGRDGLLRAVLDRHLGSRQERRIRLLDKAVEQYGDPVPVPVVLTAVLRPDLELLGKLRKHRVQVARFLGRSFAHRSPVVAGSMPELSAADLRQRLHLVLDSVAMLYATAPDPGRPGPFDTDDVEEQVRRLVAFASAGVAAPVAATTAPAAERPRKRKR